MGDTGTAKTSGYCRNGAPDTGDVEAWIVSDKFRQCLEKDGWRQISAGRSRRLDYNDQFLIFARTRPFSEVICQEKIQSDSGSATECQVPENHLLTMSNSADSGCQNDFVTQPHEEEMAQPRGFSAWAQKPLMLPQTEIWAHKSMGLPALASFRDIVSLQNIQSDRPSVVIGVDSEWVGQGPRRMLSVDGIEYEVACFDTRAFADMDDFAAYK